MFIKDTKDFISTKNLFEMKGDDNRAQSFTQPTFPDIRFKNRPINLFSKSTEFYAFFGL